MTVEGVDYAFPPRPNIAELARLGKKFACRYGGPGTLDKQLDPQEALDLSAAGIAIVANAEGANTGLNGGWSAGVSWATKAQARFAECGMPADRPIYFSADFDVLPGAWPNVADALRGAASVIGRERVGIYGGRDAVTWARRDGVAAWFWQTYAWSGGYWVPGVHIQQYRNGVQLAGADCDLNRAMQADYGQWKIGEMVDQKDVTDIWQHYLAPGGYNMQDHLLQAESFAAQTWALLQKVAEKVDLDPAELDAVKQAAAAGAEQGARAALANLPAEKIAELIVAAVPGPVAAEVISQLAEKLGS